MVAQQAVRIWGETRRLFAGGVADSDWHCCVAGGAAVSCDSKRARGRATHACLAQMHQLGQSVLAYLADFNETYPMAAYVQHYTHNSTCLFTLYHGLVPYIRTNG
jgi:hypothetical protein